MRRTALIPLAVALLVAAGPESLGRLALRAGWDGAATALSDDPAARGVALFRQGDFEGADAAFARAGRSQTYNRGLSLAARGDYALSVAYFEAMLFANPADAAARQNRDLVATMVEPVRADTTAPGRIAAQGGRPAPRTDMTELLANGSGQEWERRFDRRGLAATDDWLDSIADDPGEFLRLRLRAEHDRRASLGLIRPEEGETW